MSQHPKNHQLVVDGIAPCSILSEKLADYITAAITLFPFPCVIQTCCSLLVLCVSAECVSRGGKCTHLAACTEWPPQAPPAGKSDTTGLSIQVVHCCHFKIITSSTQLAETTVWVWEFQACVQWGFSCAVSHFAFQKFLPSFPDNDVLEKQNTLRLVASGLWKVLLS